MDIMILWRFLTIGLLISIAGYLLLARPEQRQKMRKYFLLLLGFLTLNLAALFHFGFFSQPPLATKPYNILLLVMVLGATFQFLSGILLFIIERKKTRPLQ